jgi:hypothetical protein
MVRLSTDPGLLQGPGVYRTRKGAIATWRRGRLRRDQPMGYAFAEINAIFRDKYSAACINLVLQR